MNGATAFARALDGRLTRSANSRARRRCSPAETGSTIDGVIRLRGASPSEPRPANNVGRHLEGARAISHLSAHGETRVRGRPQTTSGQHVTISRHIKYGRGRWVVERTFAWLR